MEQSLDSVPADKELRLTASPESLRLFSLDLDRDLDLPAGSRSKS